MTKCHLIEVKVISSKANLCKKHKINNNEPASERPGPIDPDRSMATATSFRGEHIAAPSHAPDKFGAESNTNNVKALPKSDDSSKVPSKGVIANDDKGRMPPGDIRITTDGIGEQRIRTDSKSERCCAKRSSIRAVDVPASIQIISSSMSYVFDTAVATFLLLLVIILLENAFEILRFSGISNYRRNR